MLDTMQLSHHIPQQRAIEKLKKRLNNSEIANQLQSLKRYVGWKDDTRNNSSVILEQQGDNQRPNTDLRKGHNIYIKERVDNKDLLLGDRKDTSITKQLTPNTQKESL